MAFRPSWDEYFMAIAETAATRSTCLHRHTGAVLVRDRQIVSTGYNGSAPGQPHSEDLGYCEKERSGQCRAEGMHAEANAISLAAKAGISVNEATLYTVYSPCRACCNLLAVAGIKEVRYRNVYEGFPEGPEYLKTLGIEVEKV